MRTSSLSLKGMGMVTDPNSLQRNEIFLLCKVGGRGDLCFSILFKEEGRGDMNVSLLSNGDRDDRLSPGVWNAFLLPKGKGEWICISPFSLKEKGEGMRTSPWL